MKMKHLAKNRLNP